MSKHGISNSKKSSSKKTAKNSGRDNNVNDNITEKSLKNKHTRDKDTRVRKAKDIKHNKQRKKRNILSYENVPIDEYKEYSHDKVKVNKKNVKKAVIIIVILALLALIVFLFANRDSITWDNFSTWVSEDILGKSDGDGYPVQITGTTISKGNFTLMDGRPSYASDTSYVELGDSAGKIINTQLSFSTPVVRGTRNYNIVYGAGDKNFIINDSKETKHKGSMKNKIFTADINDSGYYAVVTEGSGYLSVLTAYNDDNKKMYEYSFADYYITSVAINQRGSGAVCCGVTTVDGAEHTKIYVLDFTEEKPQKEYDLTESVIYDIFYLSSDIVSAVANNAVYTMDLSEDKPLKEDYKSRTLTTYEYNADTKTFTVSLSRSGDGRNCDILFFNSYGEKEYTINSSYKVDSISTYKGDLAILSFGTAYILNEDGTVESKADAGTDARSILLNSGDEAYVLGISEIRNVKFD